MALEYRYQPRDAGTPVDTVKIEQHWYLTEDKTRVVPEGDPAARSLWATPGMDVPRADAERLGAAAPTVEEEPAEVAAEPAPKEKTAPPNKQRSKPSDKSAGNPATVDELRARAASLEIHVDNRWGADRLRSEIAAAETAEEG